MRYPSFAIRGVVVAQFPNPPRIVALLAVVAGWIVGEDSGAYPAIRAAFYLGLVIWAWEEATRVSTAFARSWGLWESST